MSRRDAQIFAESRGRQLSHLACGGINQRNKFLRKDVDRILELTTFVVATRPGWDFEGPYKEKVECVDMPPVDASSTAIRERIRGGDPVGDLVPASVAEYIARKGLYRGKS